MKAISLYKKLLKSTRNTFANDFERIAKVSQHIRNQFELHRNETDQEKIHELLKIGNQVETIVRKNVVQAWQKPNDPSTYVLNLTPEKEINDNATIKTKSGQPAMK
jgi:complex III assembly factor LYRM7